MTIGDLIRQSLRRLGVVAPGDAVPADMATIGLERVNDWIDGFANEGLLIYVISRTTWTLTGAASYSVGLGATINVARPVSATAILTIGRLDSATSPASEYLSGPPLTDDQFAGIAQKALTGEAQAWFYRPTVPTGTLIPWPIPASGTGVIYSPSPLAEFTALTDTVIMPQGYRRFFGTNLALELADEFDAQPSQTLLKAAIDSKTAIKRANTRLLDLGFDPAMLIGASGRSNIYSGVE